MHIDRMRCLNATIYAIFRAASWSKRWKKQRNAAEFLGSILYHANSFSMLRVRAAIGIRWHCNVMHYKL